MTHGVDSFRETNISQHLNSIKCESEPFLDADHPATGSLLQAGSQASIVLQICATSICLFRLFEDHTGSYHREMPNHFTISIVTPLYRSSAYIEEFYARVVSTVTSCSFDAYQIIFVDDCGPENDLEIARSIAARDPNVLVVELACNAGQHAATMAGLEHATGELICIMDSDLEEAPEWIADFLSEIEASNCDVVYATSDAPKKGYFYRLMRRLFYFLLNSLSPVSFPQNVCTARLMRRPYVQALLSFPERQLYMAGIWHMAGFDQRSVSVHKIDRSPTNYRFSQLASVLINAVTAFSTKPLMLISVAGIMLSAIALLFTLWIVLRYFVVGVAAEGWASVMAAVLTIGGVSLFFNGIMAIYVAKIFIEVKQRPRTIIKAIHGLPKELD